MGYKKVPHHTRPRVAHHHRQLQRLRQTTANLTSLRVSAINSFAFSPPTTRIRPLTLEHMANLNLKVDKTKSTTSVLALGFRHSSLLLLPTHHRRALLDVPIPQPRPCVATKAVSSLQRRHRGPAYTTANRHYQQLAYFLSANVGYNRNKCSISRK